MKTLKYTLFFALATLLMAAEKDLDETQCRRILESKNRSEAGFSVPAHGLYLTNIEYPFLNK